MKELIEEWAQKNKNLLHKLFYIVVAIILIGLICEDLVSRDGGYIRPAVSYIIGIGMSCCADAVEIANTPLASLTIAKIFLFIWYCSVAWLLTMFAYGIWSCLRDFLKRHDENEENFIEYEKQRLEEQRKAKEDQFYTQSQDECSEFVSLMQEATSLSELDELFRESASKWPRWTQQLTRIYINRKKWLEKNSQSQN